MTGNTGIRYYGVHTYTDDNGVQHQIPIIDFDEDEVISGEELINVMRRFNTERDPNSTATGLNGETVSWENIMRNYGISNNH